MAVRRFLCRWKDSSARSDPTAMRKGCTLQGSGLQPAAGVGTSERQEDGRQRAFPSGAPPRLVLKNIDLLVPAGAALERNGSRDRDETGRGGGRRGLSRLGLRRRDNSWARGGEDCGRERCAPVGDAGGFDAHG